MEKTYIKPKYANHSNSKLEVDSIKNFDDITYMLRKGIDITKLTRKQLEELHEAIDTLYWICFDLS